MNLQTVRTVCKELGISEASVRRAIASKSLPTMRLGNRMLVDLDTAQSILKPAKAGASIEDVSQATGLNVTAIRRGIREGWIPYEKPGKAYIFQLDEVLKAIEQRMAEN